MSKDERNIPPDAPWHAGDDYEYDEWEESLHECGWYPDGDICLRVGTEYCDWHCQWREIFERELQEVTQSDNEH